MFSIKTFLKKICLFFKHLHLETWVRWLLFVAMLKHHGQHVVWGGRGLSHFTAYSSSSKEAMVGSQGRNTELGTEADTMEESA